MDMGTKLQAEFVQALHIFKEWTAKLRSAYDKIKTFIDSVFGAKFAKQFPSKPASFQDVALVFPNNTYGTYNGTSLLAAAGTPIVAPMAGVVSKVSSDIVRLEVTENSLRNYYIFLGHVSLAAGVTGPVKKNATIGTVTTGQSTIHVSIQHKLTKRFIDPAKYLPRRMPGILGNGFKPDPNFYSLTVVGKQIVPPTAIIDLNSLRSVNKTGRTSTKARRGFEADIGQDRSLARRDLLSDLGLPEFNVKIPNVCTDDEFQNAPEICGGGMLPEFRRSLLLFKTKQFFLVAGFVPVTFELQFDAVMGIQAGVSVCLIGLEVKPKVTPEFGVAMQGSLSVGAFIEITLLARGTVADTHVPIAVFFPLAKFPIGTCIQINVEILPLQLEVSVGVEIDFVFFSKSWFVTIVRLTLDKITFLVTDTCPQPDSRQLPPKDSGTIVDVTAPIVHQLSISQVANVPTSAPLLFARFSIGDPESGIANASIAVGWNPGDSTVAAPVLIPRDQGESITIPGLADISLFDEKTLYVTITVFNQHQMMTKQSQKLVWDLSPPVIKIAEIFTPFAQYTFPIGKNETRTALRKAMQTFKYDLTQQIGGGALQGFSDRLDFSYVIQDATAQSTLEYAVGTGAAPDLITSLRDWTELPATQTQGTLAFDSLQLSHGVTYHLALRSLNALGYESTTLSSGTLIDLTPPVVGSIFMGPTLRQNWNATNVITNAVFNFFGFSDAESDVACEQPSSSI
ncbi:uncharacterized protein EV422DRAFT_160796 [Fimicolochytrium jonesii]|uniref:uncharacterized protein n=1 Tax=Fimicolochytrium jonesii TaxID=1396493 RepID=UPI0022FE7E8B|nr:uncharacterized protein EV422DRAFT_160796 [Fimicolochytrium jonesii]KAI8826280.1 hypothetical protein EV422DRAFT_160796 [Fimicolochytrium jonesii]